MLAHLVAGARSSSTPAGDGKDAGSTPAQPPLAEPGIQSPEQAAGDADVWSRLDALDPVLAETRPDAIGERLESLLDRLDASVVEALPVGTRIVSDVLEQEEARGERRVLSSPFDKLPNLLDAEAAPEATAPSLTEADDKILLTTARALKAMDGFCADLVALEHKLNKADEAYWNLLGKSRIAVQP